MCGKVSRAGALLNSPASPLEEHSNGGRQDRACNTTDDYYGSHHDGARDMRDSGSYHCLSKDGQRRGVSSPWLPRRASNSP
jgi:hypothetical protein